MAEAKKQTKAKKQAELTAETIVEEEAPEVKIETEAAEAEVKDTKTTAKAGKRSAKVQKEAGEKEAKEARKAETKTGEDKPKEVKKPARSRLERAGKKYREAAKLIDRTKNYTLAEALDLAVRTSTSKFDSSVEMHVNLGVDPRQADQNVRDVVALPAGTGKEVRVEAISDDASAEKLFAKLDKGEIDFDVLIATPSVMPRLGKYARLLGPRGLMPNPKSGTVSQNVEQAVKDAKAGRVEYRVDQAGIIHLAIGKASFGSTKLTQNAEAVLNSIRSAKPASLKGIYIKSIYVTTTMGPSVKVSSAA